MSRCHLSTASRVRLIAPGWYGVANVKWLTRIEVLDHRYPGSFMARDYVTIREEQRDGQTIWTFTTVGHDRLKSAPAKVTRRRQPVHHHGRRLGRADRGGGGRSRQRTMDAGARSNGPRHGTGATVAFAWRFWTFDWGTPAAGEHSITSRAFDVDGNIQPAPTDPYLASRRALLGEQRADNPSSPDCLTSSRQGSAIVAGLTTGPVCLAEGVLLSRT